MALRFSTLAASETGADPARGGALFGREFRRVAPGVEGLESDEISDFPEIRLSRYCAELAEAVSLEKLEHLHSLSKVYGESVAARQLGWKLSLMRKA